MRISVAGAEQGAIEAEGLTARTGLSIDATNQRSGRGCWKHTANAAYNSFGLTTGANVHNYIRIWFKIESLASAGRQSIASIFSSSAQRLWDVAINQQREVIVSRGLSSGTVIATSAPIALGQYHLLELHTWADGADMWRTHVRLNKVDLIDQTWSAGTTATPGSVRVGPQTSYTDNPTGSMTVYTDDVAVNDDTGTAENSWPDPDGRWIVAYPTADGAIGANWTLGTGTAISQANPAFEAVNNIPPQGVANLEAGSDTKQIRNPGTSSTGSDRDAEFILETPAALGVPNGSTFKVARVLAITSDSSSSLSVSHAVSGLANPVIAETAASTSGFAATYLSGWNRFTSGFVTAPTIDRSVAPVVMIGKRGTSSTNVLCSQIGLGMEYVEGTAPANRFLAAA